MRTESWLQMTDSVSLQDVLEESKELEKVANAVLGDSDDSCCTYSQVRIQTKGILHRSKCANIIGLCWKTGSVRLRHVCGKRNGRNMFSV